MLSILVCTESRSTSNELLGTRMYNMCIVVAFTDLLFNLSGQVYLLKGWKSEVLCQVTILFCAFTHSFSVFFTVIFLWWRQRALYRNPFLKHLSNRVTRVLSWISIVAIGVFAAVPTLSQLHWRRYSVNNQVRFV